MPVKLDVFVGFYFVLMVIADLIRSLKIDSAKLPDFGHRIDRKLSKIIIIFRRSVVQVAHPHFDDPNCSLLSIMGNPIVLALPYTVGDIPLKVVPTREGYPRGTRRRCCL